MPRKPDVALEGRIVDAAYRIWSQQGEGSVTMRAVARAARTTTPTLYQRFRNKQDLKHFLEERARQKLFDSVSGARSVLDICGRTLKFTSEHRHEYRLLATDWGIRYAQGLPMRSLEQLKRLLANELGGSPAEHRDLAFQLFAIVHGTAVLRPSDAEQGTTAEAMEQACLRACEALLRDRARSRKNSSKT
ncbi:MAG TPA: helix-turn-helix domain-containing protein [Candidatus Limnocylindrales bacterium]|nr:helix-turn-helix domain-containing protein [Candidatus Limnocylindrales bacterium]